MPFTIDSLDNSSTEGMQFNGTLVSGGIFPDIDYPLTVQPDYSLGFVVPTPEEGYPAYQGKGTYFSEINLSYMGLRGKGTLNYLTSVSKTEDFHFFLDSMNAEVQDYKINEQTTGVQYPDVVGIDVFEQWYPYKDLMLITNKTKLIKMYTEQSELNGQLALTPEGLSGKGKMEFSDVEMESHLYKYKQHDFTADTADFRPKTLKKEELAFDIHNYKAHIDFEKRMGEFVSNGGSSQVDFPINQYICFMDRFNWYMDKSQLEFANNETTVGNYDNMNMEELADAEISGNAFISVHPDQDSLKFLASTATFDIKTTIIEAKNVKIIKVADAAIYPDKGDVTILKKAEMKTLENAKILANTSTKFHKLYDATVNIYSRKNYAGKGSYDYVDEANARQKIIFDKIGVDSTLQTYSLGKITDSTFTLSPNFEYNGNVKLLASNQYLNFNGVCKIRHFCNINRSKFKFTGDINPNEIYIPVSSDIRNENNKKLSAGIMFMEESSNIYSCFLNEPSGYKDTSIITSQGFLTYDNIAQEYRISTKEKLKEFALPGNYLSLDTKNCTLYAEGIVNMCSNLGQFKMQTYGNGKHFITTDSAEFNIIMALDFFFTDDAMKILRKSLEENISLRGVDMTTEKFTKALADIVGKEKADKLISELNLYSVFKKLPEELQHTFFFADIYFKWDKASKSYVSKGPIGIGSMDKIQINKYVDGCIQVEKKRSGDGVTIYLEMSQSEWYFFKYKNGRMEVISSDQAFNNIISMIEPEKRQLDVKKDESPYMYYISTEKKKKDFLKIMGYTTD